MLSLRNIFNSKEYRETSPPQKKRNLFFQLSLAAYAQGTFILSYGLKFISMPGVQASNPWSSYLGFLF